MRNQKKNNDCPDLKAVAERYTVKTGAYIDKLLSHKAIARQYLPDSRELITMFDENVDPIGDYSHSPVKGIVHRYPDRVLLKPHHACAVYCRFCFRRDMVGRNGEILDAQELEQAIDYIRSKPEIWEVILTGGDPLVLSTRRLATLFEALNGIDHVKSIRIHTRVPVASPASIKTETFDIIAHSPKNVTISIHCNHSAEITDEVRVVLQRLHQSGAMLVSQSVLLKGVNDNFEALEQLFRKLIEVRVKPYYLHHLDKAQGTSHFRVKLIDGLNLYQKLRGRLSGICIPVYVLDIPDGYGKVEINSSAIKIKENYYLITDMSGVQHIYKD